MRKRITVAWCLVFLAAFEASLWVTATVTDSGTVVTTHELQSRGQNLILGFGALDTVLSTPNQHLPDGLDTPGLGAKDVEPPPHELPRWPPPQKEVPRPIVSQGRGLLEAQASSTATSGGEEAGGSDADDDDNAARAVPTKPTLHEPNANNPFNPPSNHFGKTESSGHISLLSAVAWVFLGVLAIALLLQARARSVPSMPHKQPLYQDAQPLDLEMGTNEPRHRSQSLEPSCPRSNSPCRARSASAPPSLTMTGRLHHALPRKCAECAAMLTPSANTFVAVDKVFCSPECRGDHVESSQDSQGMIRIKGLVRIDTNLGDLEALCRQQY